MNERSIGVAGLGVPGIEDLQPIGRGGFATIYRGWQAAFHRPVAVKILDAMTGVPSGPRFRREVMAMGSLSDHPNVVPVYDAGMTQDRPYLVMPFLSGGSLADRMTDAPLPAVEVARLGAAMADALAAAHRLGLLHRDVKPANILYTAYGQPQLADFGIARFADSTVTQGQTSATIAYAPPEVLGGEGATPVSDVYSLGATLYTASAGKPPFVARPGEPPVGLALRITQETPPGLDASGVPAGLAAVIQRAMAKDPAERYPSAAALRDALASVDLDAAGSDAATTAPMPAPSLAPTHTPTHTPTGNPVSTGNPTHTPTAAPPPAGAPTPAPIRRRAGVSSSRPAPARRAAPIDARPSAAATGPRRPLGLVAAVAALVVAILAVAVVLLLRSNTAPSSHVAGSTVGAVHAPTSTGAPASTGAPGVGAAPSGDPAQAARDYYGLIDQHQLDEAYTWLSPAYQQRTGGASYRGFWATIANVAVLRATAGDRTATVTLRYTKTDGTTSTETATLRFIPDPKTGRLLIDDYRPG